MLCRQEKGAGKARGNKGSPAFHWLSPSQKQRGGFLLPVGLSYVKGVRAPPSGFSTVFEVSAYSFYIM